jgi:hypothetical protein
MRSGLRMNVVQQADVDEIRANMRDGALFSAFRRSVDLLHTMVNSSGPPQRGLRAGAMAMSNPPLLREEDKTALDESIEKLQAECQQLEGNAATLRSEREEKRLQSEKQIAQQGKQSTTQPSGKQTTQQQPEGNKTASQKKDEPEGAKAKGEMTVTQGTAKTPDARKVEQNQSTSPTANQPVASQEDLEGDNLLSASELSDEPGAAAISVDDIIAIVTVIANLWKRFRRG